MPTPPTNRTAPPVVTIEQGDIVLYHFTGRHGLVTRPALVIEAHADGTADLDVFIGADHDAQIDLGDAGGTMPCRVPGATKPTAGRWTAKE